MRLKHKVAIVTGGAGGIGEAVCLRYAVEGARVVVHCNSSVEHAQEVVRQITAGGGEALAVRADVSQEPQVRQMVEATIERFGGVDILVNNAAVYQPRKEWQEYSVEEWDRFLAVNLRGYWLCARAAFPCMVNRGQGKIINVSSVAAFEGSPGFLPYVASKGAILAFTRALAREVAKYNITVNCISPGAVQTLEELRLFADQQGEIARLYAARQALPRREQPEDVVGTYVFLASRESDFITGQNINVDGGYNMR